MKPGIRFTREWSDIDMVALHIGIADGNSTFVNRIYVGHRQLRATVEGLQAFKDQIHGGLFDLRFGEFGPEYASGAIHARFQFRKQAKILVQIAVQSGFDSFEDKEIASEAKFWLVSEPALLDAFIDALEALSQGSGEQAELEVIPWN